MKRKQKPRGSRDNCTNCESQQRNGVGHLKDYCSYKGGPYEGKFKEAAAARRASMKTKRARSDQPAALRLTEEVQVYFSELVETTEELESAKKNPFEFVVKTLNLLETRQAEESLQQNKRITELENKVSAQHSDLDHLTEANRRLTQSFRATNDIVHGINHRRPMLGISGASRRLEHSGA